MSIDARILSTDISGDGKVGILYLIPRNKMACAGQPKLYVDNFDGWFPPIGTEIWGAGSEILIGETVIYRRYSINRVVRIKALPG